MTQPLITAPKTLEQISALRPKYAGIGSRETPSEITSIMSRIAHCLCDAGWLGMSGDAENADTAFHTGAMRSKRYPEIGFAAFLPWNGILKRSINERRYESPAHGLYDASMFENWESASHIAKDARGSFEGLERGGIALHSRNAYQVLSPSLRDPVQRVFMYAKPVGLTKVTGGTNTAYQIALKHGINVLNLYHGHARDRALTYLDEQGY